MPQFIIPSGWRLGHLCIAQQREGVTVRAGLMLLHHQVEQVAARRLVI